MLMSCFGPCSKQPLADVHSFGVVVVGVHVFPLNSVVRKNMNLFFLKMPQNDEIIQTNCPKIRIAWTSYRASVTGDGRVGVQLCNPAGSREAQRRRSRGTSDPGDDDIHLTFMTSCAINLTTHITQFNLKPFELIFLPNLTSVKIWPHFWSKKRMCGSLSVAP